MGAICVTRLLLPLSVSVFEDEWRVCDGSSTGAHHTGLLWSVFLGAFRIDSHWRGVCQQVGSCVRGVVYGKTFDLV